MTAIARPGDIVLVSGHGPLGRLIQWVTVCPWDHAALMADGYLIEAIEDVGVVESPADKYELADHIWLRPRVDPAAVEAALQFAGAWMGKHYGWREALTSGVRDLLHVPLHPRFGHLDCSGLIAATYANAGAPITRAIVPTPADLWSSTGSDILEEPK